MASRGGPRKNRREPPAFPRPGGDRANSGAKNPVASTGPTTATAISLPQLTTRYPMKELLFRGCHDRDLPRPASLRPAAGDRNGLFREGRL